MKSSIMNWGAALLLLLAVLGSPREASAQNEYATPAGANQAAPLFVIGCLDLNGRAVPANSVSCNGSAWGGGGGGGSVTQGTVPWVVSATAFLHASTSALGSSLVVKASAGSLGAYNCTAITGGAAGYCIAYNSTSAPAPGALTGSLVLDFCYFSTTARGCSLSRLPSSIAFGTGIVILATSAVTPYTYTTGVDTAAIEADYF